MQSNLLCRWRNNPSPLQNFGRKANICIQTDTFRTAICHDKINLKQMVILTKPMINFAGLIK